MNKIHPLSLSCYFLCLGIFRQLGGHGRNHKVPDGGGPSLRFGCRTGAPKRIRLLQQANQRDINGEVQKDGLQPSKGLKSHAVLKYTILSKVLAHLLLMKGLTTLVISMSTNLNF